MGHWENVGPGMRQWDPGERRGSDRGERGPSERPEVGSKTPDGKSASTTRPSSPEQNVQQRIGSEHYVTPMEVALLLSKLPELTFDLSVRLSAIKLLAEPVAQFLDEHTWQDFSPFHNPDVAKAAMSFSFGEAVNSGIFWGASALPKLVREGAMTGAALGGQFVIGPVLGIMLDPVPGPRNGEDMLPLERSPPLDLP